MGPIRKKKEIKSTQVKFYLDGDDKMAAVFEKVVSIEGDDTRLIRLSNVSENHIDHP